MYKQRKKGILIWGIIVVLAMIVGLISQIIPGLLSGHDVAETEWEDLLLDYEMIETAGWTGLAETDCPVGEKGLLFHNNGQFMDCDIMAAEGDCRLVGVYCFNFWDRIPVESYFFSDKAFANEESLLAWILPEQHLRDEQLMGGGLDFQAKYFSFAFLDEEGGVESSLTARVQAGKKTENVEVNGISGGVIWTASVNAAAETESSRGISYFSTLLDVKEEDQQLIHWEPRNSTAPMKTEISFSLSDGLKRTVQYTDLPMMADCSMSESFGKWVYELPQMPQRKLSMKPSVEVTDLDGVLSMELQQTLTVNTGVFRKEELDTGRIRMAFPDV